MRMDWKNAYESKSGSYQHYNKLYIAGTRDIGDAIDDLKLPLDDILNKTTRGRDADAYYRSHHEIDIVVGHSLGGAVGLSLEKQYEKQDGNPYGIIIQSKTFGAPVISSNLSRVTTPNRIRYFGDPINALDFNATIIMPSFDFRFNNSAHYTDLFIKDAIPVHDTMRNNLTKQPDDEDAVTITA